MPAIRAWPGLGTVIYFAAAVALSVYFVLATVRGDYGLVRRIEVEAQAKALRADAARLEDQVAALKNKTQRLSDEYLDLDLLDERARKVLGLVRADEIVIR